VVSKFATYEIEEGLKEKGYRFIAGIDEVGRGPGAGPVVAAAVIIPDDYLPKLMGRVKDSKKLSESKREALYEEITDNCMYGVGRIASHTIDDINILNATKMAMEKALVEIDPDYVIIDGRIELELLKQLEIPQRSIIRGDDLSISIAAASIVAKVVRDEEMRTLHWIYPQYNWIKNKGYLTKEHIEAIKTYGITEWHRTSFRKVGDLGEYNG
jgi:ribonuclease HII